MVEILPLRGWLYNKGKIADFASVITPPNDVISKEQREQLKKHPYNFVNLILPDGGDDKYEHAKDLFGLPDGYQGNSEVGHLTIGSGRIIYQPMVRINKSIESGEFFKNKSFLGALQNCKKHKSNVHIIDLLQSEGVHAHENHLYALLDLCKKENFKDVYIHVITDGRDAPVNDGVKHVEKLIRKIKQVGIGTIATLSGRYYTMDRDKRWDRTKKAYDCIVNAEGEEFADVIETMQSCYQNKETDEFIVPRKMAGYPGVQKGDSFIFYNFRTDRTRQLTRAIVEKEFEGWDRNPLGVYYVAMTQYYEPMNAHVAFEDISLKHLLGEIVSKAGLKQLRISETEKYAHVTFFFNGQVETPNEGEDRIMIPSPKVATYDLKPEMSVYEVTDRLVKEIDADKYQFIVTNIVNGDLVGHTGIHDACIKAVQSVDECVGTLVQKALEKNYIILVFADHGNIEDQSDEWRTSHTLNDVPLILVSNDSELKKAKLRKGGLVDIAPTVLEILGIKQPIEMTGESLIQH